MAAKHRSRRGDVARVLVAAALISIVVLVAATHLAESSGPAATPSSGSVASSASDAGDPQGLFDVLGTAPHHHHVGPVLVVGDSITVGARDAGLAKLLTADGWRPQIVADKGQAPRWGIGQVKALAHVPPLVVVELGTNPSAGIGTFPDDIKVMVATLKAEGAQRIVWLTPVHRGDTVYDNKVDLLRALAATEPALVVADWGAIAQEHTAWFQSDGLHYTDVGYAVLAHYLADVVDQNDPSG